MYNERLCAKGHKFYAHNSYNIQCPMCGSPPRAMLVVDNTRKTEDLDLTGTLETMITFGNLMSDQTHTPEQEKPFSSGDGGDFGGGGATGDFSTDNE